MLAEKPRQVTTLRSTEVQRHFREVVNCAGSGQEHIIVERDGLPVIVMISLAEYQLLMQEREQRLKRFDTLTRRMCTEFEQLGLTEEEVMAQFEESRQRVYEEQYGHMRT